MLAFSLVCQCHEVYSTELCASKIKIDGEAHRATRRRLEKLGFLKIIVVVIVGFKEF